VCIINFEMIARLARVVKPRVAYNFSKDPKEGKGGKKEEPKAAAPVVEQVTNDQLLQKWFHNAHPSLSPSEATYTCINSVSSRKVSPTSLPKTKPS
jgi:hypothetical protein